MRDATVVLDEILDNETELPLFTHATDTAGYTELIFCLFDLLGYQFAPRLRDLGEISNFIDLLWSLISAPSINCSQAVFT
jgi:TnpA family transposase